MMSEEGFCSKCGKKIEKGRYSLMSDMCNDCYEKVNPSTPENQYPKEYIKQEFNLPEGEFSFLDINIFFSKCKEEIVNIIKKVGNNKKQYFACMFSEFNMKDKIKELIKNRHFELEFSYYLTNNKFHLLPKFEDRNKEKSWIIVLKTRNL